VATLFLDSNAVVKYYVMEPGSDWVQNLVNANENICLLCAISMVEVASALAQLQRSSHLGKQRLRRIYTNFREDIRQGQFFTHAIDTKTLDLAAEIALRYPLKGFDATQVASAILAAEILDTDVIFISGDKQALHAALSEGLAIDNPFDHADGK
jgi:predicted nucleic acid-binding protein